MVECDWLMPDGSSVLSEHTRFVFRAARDGREIERVTRLTAGAREVRFADNKEGVLGLRVARALEAPSDKPERFTDAAGRRKIKGNMDIELAVDAMELAEHLDHIVLFSGDGDFRSLVEALQHKGKRVSVVSTLVTTPPMVADELRRQADQFIDLAHLQNEIGRDPAERAQREQRRRPEPVDEFESEDLIET